MLRFKLLSAQGTGEEKNISLWLKRLRTRKENRGEDKLWGLGGMGGGTAEPDEKLEESEAGTCWGSESQL